VVISRAPRLLIEPAGEVVVNKARTTEQQQVADTVRRTEGHVDQDRMGETVAPAGQQRLTPAGATAGSRTAAMPRYRGYWQSRYGTSGGRWEDYEPSYRYGWEMRNDPRYQGRNFDEVEVAADRWSGGGGSPARTHCPS
jgi:hypothetical protein